MKFPSGWHIEVLRPADGRAYANIAHGVEKYVVGIPGQPFEVKVTPPTHIFAQHPLIRLSLHVDGRSSGSHKHIHSDHPSKTFKGFVSNVTGRYMTSQFLFGTAKTYTSCTLAAPILVNTGRLTVIAEHVVQVPGQKAHSQNPVALQPAPASQAVEGKKWFLQPSLSVVPVRSIARPAFSTKIHGTVQQLTALHMRMENAPILVLRKALNPENPEHRAIIEESQMSSEEETEEASIAECVVDAPAARDIDSSSRGTKRKVKAETRSTQ